MDDLLRRVVMQRESESELRLVTALPADLPCARGEYVRPKMEASHPKEKADAPICRSCNARRLRSNNRSGVCNECARGPARRRASQAPRDAEQAPYDEEDEVDHRAAVESRIAEGTAKVRARFDALTRALGLDPDDLVVAFQERLIKKITQKALTAVTEETDE